MRSLEITWVLSKYLVLYKFTSHRKKGFGERLKLACGELGLSFIKIGQILSMRYDLLSREDCRSLQELLDNVNPIGADEIIRLVEKEYGKPWRQVFKTFELVPLGSASISQVHKAELFDGTKVAVKIKRPGVDNKFLSDIEIMKALAGFASFFSAILRHIQIKELVAYFENWIKQELDFELEAKNMRLIKEQYSFGSKNFRQGLGKGLFIAPYESLCNKNIIVMDFIDGIPMNRKEEILNNPEYDIEKSLKTYMSAAMHNWFREDIDTYLFQADPHLSNVLALPHGDAANIDCGLISFLTKKEGLICKRLIVAVYMQDLDKTGEIIAEMSGFEYKKYAEILRPDLENYLVKTRESGFGFWFIDLARILIKHRIKFPLFITTFGRTNLVLDGLMMTYMPDKTTLDILGDDLREQAIRHTAKNLANIDWLKMAYALTEKVKQMPGTVAEFIENPLKMVSKIVSTIKTTP